MNQPTLEELQGIAVAQKMKIASFENDLEAMETVKKRYQQRCGEMQATIERLEKEVERLKEAFEFPGKFINRQEKEIHRLESALRKIADIANHHNLDSLEDTVYLTCKAALEGKE